MPSWPYGSWISNYIYLCNQWLSPLTLWVRIPLRRGVLDTALCERKWRWFAPGRWFSPCIPVSAINKTYRHDITEILLKLALNTITSNPTRYLRRKLVNNLHVWAIKNRIVSQFIDINSNDNVSYVFVFLRKKYIEHIYKQLISVNSCRSYK